jgi:hypothetical protein
VRGEISVSMSHEINGNCRDSKTVQGAQPNQKSTPFIISLPLIFFIGFMLISQVANGMYVGLEKDPSGGFRLLQHLVLFSLAGDWLLKDTRHHHVDWVFDMGFFLFIAWPLILPFYLFKTRGFTAVLIILGFLGGYFVATLFGMIVSNSFLD